MYLVFKEYSKRKTYNLDLSHSKINAKIKSENSIKKYMYHKSDMMGEREDGGCLLYTALGFCHLVQTKVQFSWKKSHTSRVLLFHLHSLEFSVPEYTVYMYKDKVQPDVYNITDQVQ